MTQDSGITQKSVMIKSMPEVMSELVSREELDV